MKKFLKSILLGATLLFGASFAVAQGAAVNFLAPANVQNFAQNGNVTFVICNLGATISVSAACSPNPTIYSANTLSTASALTQPVTVPSNGQIQFFIAPGTYLIEYKFPASAGSQFVVQNLSADVAGSLGDYQGTTSVGITDTAFHALIAASSDAKIPANTLNTSNARKVRIHATGVYTNAAASLLNVEAMVCTVSGCGSGTVVAPAGCTVTSTNQANSLTNGQFSLDCTLTTTSTIGASGTFMAKSYAGFNLGAATSAVQSFFQDTATAVSAAIDQTSDEFINVGFKFSTSNAGNSATLHELDVYVEN